MPSVSPTARPTASRSWWSFTRDRDSFPSRLAHVFIGLPGGGSRLEALAGLFQHREWLPAMGRSLGTEPISELLTNIASELETDESESPDNRPFELDPTEAARRVARVGRLFTRLLTALITELTKEGFRDPRLLKLAAELTQDMSTGNIPAMVAHLQQTTPALAERYNRDPKRLGPLLALTREFLEALRTLPYAKTATHWDGSAPRKKK